MSVVRVAVARALRRVATILDPSTPSRPVVLINNFAPLPENPSEYYARLRAEIERGVGA